MYIVWLDNTDFRFSLEHGQGLISFTPRNTGTPSIDAQILFLAILVRVGTIKRLNDQMDIRKESHRKKVFSLTMMSQPLVLLVVMDEI